MVTVINSVAEWRFFIANHDRVVIDCYGVDCGPCQTIAPTMEELANKEQRVRFAKCRADSNNDALNTLLGPTGYRVAAMPTFLFFCNGQWLHELTIEGANVQRLEAHVRVLVNH